MRNIKLTIEYDGTNYHGWQSQLNAVTIQDEVNSSLRKLTGESINITGSSRTDTGVHAYGQVANFLTHSNIPAEKFTYALNALLPEDIVIVKSEEADQDFHARFSALGKKYRYIIYSSPFPSALLRKRAYHIFYPLDVNAMSEAAKHFLGNHDFKAFMASGSCVKSTVRTISEVSISNLNESGVIANAGFQGLSGNFMPACISLEIKGNGFLYNMVRIIAGTLVQVGYGKIKSCDIPGIISGLDRRKAGKTAPAHGLYLVEIYYEAFD